MPDGEEHLLFAFRLHGSQPDRTLRLQALQPERLYTLRWLDRQVEEERSGASLMAEGIALGGMAEESSEIIHLQMRTGEAS